MILVEILVYQYIGRQPNQFMILVEILFYLYIHFVHVGQQPKPSYDIGQDSF